jgi:hypothetical protein
MNTNTPVREIAVIPPQIELRPTKNGYIGIPNMTSRKAQTSIRIRFVRCLKMLKLCW